MIRLSITSAHIHTRNLHLQESNLNLVYLDIAHIQGTPRIGYSILDAFEGSQQNHNCLRCLLRFHGNKLEVYR